MASQRPPSAGKCRSASSSSNGFADSDIDVLTQYLVGSESMAWAADAGLRDDEKGGTDRGAARQLPEDYCAIRPCEPWHRWQTAYRSRERHTFASRRLRLFSPGLTSERVLRALRGGSILGETREARKSCHNEERSDEGSACYKQHESRSLAALVMTTLRRHLRRIAIHVEDHNRPDLRRRK